MQITRHSFTGIAQQSETVGRRYTVQLRFTVPVLSLHRPPTNSLTLLSNTSERVSGDLHTTCTKRTLIANSSEIKNGAYRDGF